ncbi:MAG: hypothetical protein WD834_07540, partial [Actinomycetota bacterium]
TGMVSDEQIKAVLAESKDPQEAVDRLVRAANRAGGIDNITAVVIDFVEDGSGDGTKEAAVPHQPTKQQPVPVLPPPGRTDITVVGRPIPEAPPKDRASAPARASHEPDPSRAGRVPSDRRPPGRPRRSGRALRKAGVGVGVLLAVVVLGMVGLRFYLDTQWFVGVSNGRVAIFRGVPAEIGGYDLNSVVVETTIRADDAQSLALYRELPDGITADDREAAEAIVEQIRRDVESRLTQPVGS